MTDQTIYAWIASLRSDLEALTLSDRSESWRAHVLRARLAQAASRLVEDHMPRILDNVRFQDGRELLADLSNLLDGNEDDQQPLLDHLINIDDLLSVRTAFGGVDWEAGLMAVAAEQLLRDKGKDSKALKGCGAYAFRRGATANGPVLSFWEVVLEMDPE